MPSNRGSATRWPPAVPSRVRQRFRIILACGIAAARRQLCLQVRSSKAMAPHESNSEYRAEARHDHGADRSAAIKVERRDRGMRHERRSAMMAYLRARQRCSTQDSRANLRTGFGLEASRGRRTRGQRFRRPDGTEFDADFTPAVEIDGDSHERGQSFAIEAARVYLAHGGRTRTSPKCLRRCSSRRSVSHR